MSVKYKTLLQTFFLTIIIVCCKENNIDKVVKELSSVSRVVTGIAIQNTLTENGGKVSEIVAELLNVPSGALMDQLKTAKSNSTATSLTAFENAVKQIPALRTTNFSELYNTMEILAQMRLNSSLLKSGTVKDPSDDVKALIGDANFAGITSESINYFYLLDKLLDRFLVNSFKEIKKKLETDMNKMNAYITDILIVVDKFKKLSNFYKLKETPEMLREVIYFGNVSKQYKDNVNSLTSLGSQSEDVKADISGMEIMKNLNPTDTADGLRKTLEIMKSLLEERTNSKSITSGFSNGYDDIKLIKKDLKESNLLKVFSGGKSLDKMIEELSPITKFNGKMEKLGTNWREVSGSNADLDTHLTVLTTLDQSNTSISQLSNTDSVKGAMDKVNNCVKNLMQPTNPIDYKKVDDLIILGNEIREKVGEFEKIVEAFQKTENLNEHLVQLEKWQNTSKYLSENGSDAEAEQFLNSIKLNENINVIRTMIVSAMNVADKASRLRIHFDHWNSTTEWSEIRSILDSLDGTGLSDALECLDNAKIDQNSLNQVLSFRLDMESLKQNTSAITSTVDYLKKVGKFTTELTSITTTNRRRRRKSKGIKMENGETIASSLGLGVKSLRDLSEIHESNLLVDKVVKLDDSVHTAVHHVEVKWDITLRTQLTQLLADLKTLDEFAGKKDKKSVPQVWSVFDEAVKIQGVEIDEKTLKDPVAVTLRNDSNITIQSAAGDFESLSSLHLQFSYHKAHLRSASLSSLPIQSFFHQYFELKSVNGNLKEDSKTDSNDNSGTLVAIILLPIISFGGLIASLIYFIRYKRIDKARWENREKYWSYWTYYAPEDLKNSMDVFIRKGDTNEVKRLIKEGRMINYFEAGQTPLHIAVIVQSPEMVELLIKNGADRGLKNDLELTAEEFAVESLKSKSALVDVVFARFEMKLNEGKMKKCLDVFEKLKEKTFRPHAPKQLQWRKYEILLFPIPESGHWNSIEREDVLIDFMRRHGHLIRLFPPASHWVVNDECGVYDVDTQLKKWSSDETKNTLLVWKLIFDQSMLLPAEWLRKCLENPDFFYKDHEYRVRKVKVNGKVYETLDEWKKWMRRRAQKCLSGFAVAYMGLSGDKEKTWSSISEALCLVVCRSDEEIVQFVNDPNQFPNYWRHEKKRMIVISGEEEYPYKEKLPAEVYEQVEEMTSMEFFTWLLSMNGCKDLEKRLQKLEKEEKPDIPSKTGDTNKMTSGQSAVSKKPDLKVEGVEKKK